MGVADKFQSVISLKLFGVVSSGIFSTKSEVVTRGALSELAWNDPCLSGWVLIIHFQHFQPHNFSKFIFH